jgi:hypothetical protein
MVLIFSTAEVGQSRSLLSLTSVNDPAATTTTPGELQQSDAAEVSRR